MGEGPNRGGSSRRWAVQAVEGSPKRLRTDYIDLYRIHHPDPYTDIEETLSALTDLVRAGKVRAIGSSDLPASEIVEAQWVPQRRGRHRLRTEQPTYSILDRGIEREILPACHRYGLCVLVWSPLAGPAHWPLPQERAAAGERPHGPGPPAPRRRAQARRGPAYLPPSPTRTCADARPTSDPPRENAMTVLDARALNRATLARQHLLKRSDRSVSEAVAHLCGLQAQDPQEPFTGLWSRLSDFKPKRLDDALTGRVVVRTHLMRRTVHLVSADDALAWRARHDAMLRRRVLGTYRRELAGIDMDELAAAGRAVMADQRPRTMAELVQALEDRWPGPPRRVLGELLIAALIPMAQLPPRGLWHQTAGVRNLPLSTWLERDIDPVPADGSDPIGQQLLRRYLAAYGPAASADVRAWCGLAGLPAAIKAAREELVVFRDERGRELLDLPDAPRPHPDTPAPVRFLPAFDNAILGYHDRSRIIDAPHLGLSVAGHRTVLVDGRVTATWTVRDHQLHISSLRPLTALEQEAVYTEAQDLTAFLDNRIEHIQLDTEN
ncbi:General stress protein 69 [Streptomyces sp. ADI92-24]|nr:General stress protein 69 [Streptomyces sp. ADI92-24]